MDTKARITEIGARWVNRISRLEGALNDTADWIRDRVESPNAVEKDTRWDMAEHHNDYIAHVIGVPDLEVA